MATRLSWILLTNHHVLPDPHTAAGATAIANYEARPAADAAGRVCVVPLSPADLFVTNAELDFTFCGVRGLEYLGTIALDRNGLNILMAEYVNIIQHPRGRHKHVALQDNQVVAVDPVVVRYSCDTEPGSSGSPVFNNQWRLVALHHASVATGPGEGGRPCRGADPSRHYLNEGIRLSAIALWLDSDQARSGTRRDQLGRVRGIFRGLDPRAGLFGGLGRGGCGRSAPEVVVESYRRTDQCLDVAYWDLAHLEQHPSWDRLDAIAWLMTDLGMDIWCLAGLGAETARRLCGHLRDRFHLGFVACGAPDDCAAEGAPMAILSRPETGWTAEPAIPSRSPLVVRCDGPRRVRVRSRHDSHLFVELLVARAPSASTCLAGRLWGSLGPGASRDRTGTGAKPWIEGVTAREGSAAADLILLGPGVPSTSQGLAELRELGLVATSAALGRDGGFIHIPGDPTRVSKVFLSSQFISVLGRGAELIVAADASPPPEARSLSRFEPLAARIVLGEPRGGATAGDQAVVEAIAGSGAPLSVVEMIREIVEPIVSRMVERLREEKEAASATRND
jgi:hypothetical protein